MKNDFPIYNRLLCSQFLVLGMHTTVKGDNFYQIQPSNCLRVQG